MFAPYPPGICETSDRKRMAVWRTAKAVRHNKICGLAAVLWLPRFLRSGFGLQRSPRHSLRGICGNLNGPIHNIS